MKTVKVKFSRKITYEKTMEVEDNEADRLLAIYGKNVDINDGSIHTVLDIAYMLKDDFDEDGVFTNVRTEILE